MVWSRVLTRTEPPESLAFCSGLVTAVAGLALTSFHPHPLTPVLWLALGMMGVFCAAGTLSFYFAVKHTSASNVSQYHYTQLLTGALISYVVWHDKPGLFMWLGGALIIGSGLMIALAARTTGGGADARSSLAQALWYPRSQRRNLGHPALVPRG